MTRRKDLHVEAVTVEEQIPLVILIAKPGLRGLVRVPRAPAQCQDLYRRYSHYLDHRNRRLRELTEERTADHVMQDKVIAILSDAILQKHSR